MRLAWITDPHLEFLDDAARWAFWDFLTQLSVDRLLLTGDIGTARTLPRILREMETQLPMPVSFVLGNHDYYHGSVQGLRQNLIQSLPDLPGLQWLPTMAGVELNRETFLVGQDGWADGRLGDYWGSPVLLNDYIKIEELSDLDQAARYKRLNALADDEARRAGEKLRAAFDHYPQVLFLTHVPPFREACWHEGKISNDDYLPHFSSQAMGETLVSIMKDRPRQRLAVLCGHTHGQGVARPRDNILVLTGAARYGHPSVQRVFTPAEIFHWDSMVSDFSWEVV